MNNSYKHALKQINSIREDLDKFDRGEDVSVGIQGQISAGFTALERTIDEYDSLARREIILVKQEKAFVNLRKLRDDHNELRKLFTATKQREMAKNAANDRSELLGRRHQTSTPEHPFHRDLTREEHALREHSFINETDSKLDEFISYGNTVLNDMYHQNNILKGTQRRLLDAANTLGLSRSVIQYIERRSSQDNWILIIGAGFTLFCMWAIVHYLT
ncbi:1978_t:CDS:2 [Paraglomus brasilianum]|uniref:Protein transport protein BOS1 n=1 Tax=Paraglomus brasilianum TaxID=144538 RepID=A0A9N9BZL4_9GLOM|nr:1978_t:CDS:2 [Paraglomus brasilianum]